MESARRAKRATEWRAISNFWSVSANNLFWDLKNSRSQLGFRPKFFVGSNTINESNNLNELLRTSSKLTSFEVVRGRGVINRDRLLLLLKVKVQTTVKRIRSSKQIWFLFINFSPTSFTKDFTRWLIRWLMKHYFRSSESLKTKENSICSGENSRSRSSWVFRIPWDFIARLSSSDSEGFLDTASNRHTYLLLSYIEKGAFAFRTLLAITRHEAMEI